MWLELVVSLTSRGLPIGTVFRGEGPLPLLLRKKAGIASPQEIPMIRLSLEYHQVGLHRDTAGFKNAADMYLVSLPKLS